MLRLVIGGFLIVHGLIHAAIWLPQAFQVRATATADAPFDPGHSWLISRGSVDVARWSSLTLAILAVVFLVAAGVGLWLGLSWWSPAAIIGSLISLLLFVLFFDPWLVLGIAIDLALLWSLGWSNWAWLERLARD